MKKKDSKDLEKFLAQITDVQLALWSSSWGRLQCTAETSRGDVYTSWSGDTREKVSMEMIIKAFELIGEQLPDKEIK